MEQFFISELKIIKVRHLENISISLSKEGKKRLNFNGCN